MHTATTIKCEKCGNADPERFETVTEGYNLSDKYLRGQTLVGYRCMNCGTIEKR